MGKRKQRRKGDTKTGPVGACAVCHKPLSKTQKRFCSDDCRIEHLRVAMSARQRKKAEDRAIHAAITEPPKHRPTCNGCGNTMPPKSGRRKYCSATCKEESKQRERDRKRTHVCSGCGQRIENRESKDLPSAPRSHELAKYRTRKKYWCVICEALHEAEKNGKPLPGWWIDRVTL